jgi:threonine/homoserine/homoserine lactone efflux protein
MFTLSHFIPTAFPALVLAHFVALLSPGPDFFLLTGHAIRHRLAGSAFICLGIATGNAVYILLALAGWHGMAQQPILFMVVEITGALYLCWLGYQFVRSPARNMQLQQHTRELTFRKQFVTGLASALLNPKNALFYMSLMTVILGNKVTLLQQSFCGVWMFLAVLGWDLLMATLISHPKLQQILNHQIHRIEHIAGVVLTGFGLALLWRRLG